MPLGKRVSALPQILFYAEGGHHEAILYKLKLNQSVTTIPTGLYLLVFRFLFSYADTSGVRQSDST